MPEKYDYDAIIIGAGISGLVCGCYLAKAGLKTLIVEKNAKAGGYCTSFRKEGFHFDPCVHALSSLRRGGLLNKILEDLQLVERIKFYRHDPSDLIITPDFKISIFHNLIDTIQEFHKYFPKEKKEITAFFRFILEAPTFYTVRRLSLLELLDQYFKDTYLKATLSFVISMCLGVNPIKVSALVSCLLLREFIFDGGYYPFGGIQAFPNLLLKRFKELKGKCVLNTKVDKINIKNNVVTGVRVQDNEMKSIFVISACDAKQTFFDLICNQETIMTMREVIDSSETSASFFLSYIGTFKKVNNRDNLKSNIFVLNNYKTLFSNSNVINFDNLVIHAPSLWDEELNKYNGDSFCLATRLNNYDEESWTEEKRQFYSNRLIELSRRIIPDLSQDNIKLTLTATPFTFYKWTMNWKGAAFGWASTPKQFGRPEFTQKTVVKNLYLTGHWANQSSGVSLVANSGFITADLITYCRMNKL